MKDKGLNQSNFLRWIKKLLNYALLFSNNGYITKIVEYQTFIHSHLEEIPSNQ